MIMDNEKKTYWTDDPELVEKYVLGQFSEEERQRLEAEIADCEPCKEKLHHELQLVAGIRRYGRDQLKSRLRLRVRSQQVSYSYRYQYIALAAAIVVIALGVGVYRLWFSDIGAPNHFNTREVTLAQPDTSSDESTMQNEKPKVEEEATRDRSSQRAESSSASTLAEQVEPSSSQESETRQEGFSSRTRRQKTPTAEFAERTVSFPTRSMWLIGKVVVMTERKPSTEPQALMAEQQQQSPLSKSEQRIKSYTIVREGFEQQVQLEQRLFRELPRSRQTQIGKTQLVETFVQQDSAGLRLIIYSDTLLPHDLENASVEVTAKDSLIVVTPLQRIYYKLPDSFRPQTRLR